MLISELLYPIKMYSRLRKLITTLNYFNTIILIGKEIIPVVIFPTTRKSAQGEVRNAMSSKYFFEECWQLNPTLMCSNLSLHIFEKATIPKNSGLKHFKNQWKEHKYVLKRFFKSRICIRF